MRAPGLARRLAGVELEEHLLEAGRFDEQVDEEGEATARTNGATSPDRVAVIRSRDDHVIGNAWHPRQVRGAPRQVDLTACVGRGARPRAGRPSGGRPG